MRAVIKSERKPGCECVEMPKPSPRADEVLIEVKATAICGTDINYWKWNDGAANFADQYGVKFPFILGHECSGVVLEVGSEVEDVKVGDRVAFETHIYCGKCYHCRTGQPHNCQNMKIYGTSCDGCFAEYATAPANVCFKLPESVGWEEGALFEPAGVAMHAVPSARWSRRSCSPSARARSSRWIWTRARSRWPAATAPSASTPTTPT